MGAGAFKLTFLALMGTGIPVAIAMAGLWVLGTNYLPPNVATGGVG